MPWNGSGTYVLPPAFSPEVNGTVVDATRYNGLTSDVATGLTAALAKNGENSPTTNLPMGGFRHTGALAAAAAGQYLVFDQTGASLGGLIVSSDTAVSRGIYGATDLKFAVGGTTPWSMAAGSSGDFLPATDNARAIGSTNFHLAALWTRKVQTSAAAGLEINASDSAGTVFLRTAGSTRLTVDQFGRVYGANIHNNAQSPTGTTNQYFASGTYTPTTSNLSNVSTSFGRKSSWVRVGNVVKVAGTINVTPTAASSATSVQVSVPIASAIASAYDAGGTGTRDNPGISCNVFGQSANNVRIVYTNDTVVLARDISFVFFYEVL